MCASLLGKICDKYDGTMTYLVNYCLQLMNFSLEQKNQECFNKYNILVADNNQWLLTNISEELLIETCLLIFCIIVEKIDKNKILL